MVLSPSHSILSTKIRVRSQRSCWGHAQEAVSRLLVFLPCTGESHRLISLQRSQLGRCRRDIRISAQVVLTTPTCASAAPSDIRS